MLLLLKHIKLVSCGLALQQIRQSLSPPLIRDTLSFRQIPPWSGLVTMPESLVFRSLLIIFKTTLLTSIYGGVLDISSVLSPGLPSRCEQRCGKRERER